MITTLNNLETKTLEHIKKSIESELHLRNKKRYDDLYKSFDVIIQNNIDTRNVGCKESFSQKYYLKEICTVHLNSGRQVGKTQYICDRFNSHTDIIITNFTKSFVIDRMRGKTDKDPRMVFNLPDFLLARFDGMSGKKTTVWLDEIGRAEDDAIDAVYEKLACIMDMDKSPVIIRMGS